MSRSHSKRLFDSVRQMTFRYCQLPRDSKGVHTGSRDPVLVLCQACSQISRTVVFMLALCAFVSVRPVMANCLQDGTCVVIERSDFPTGDWAERRRQRHHRLRRSTFNYPALHPLNDSNHGRLHLVSIDHILDDGTVYDPSTQGALAGIDYSEARRQVSVGGVSTHAALRQGGVIYRSAFNIINKTGDVGSLRVVLYNEDNPSCLEPPPPTPPHPGLEVTKTMESQTHLWDYDTIIPYEITVTNVSGVPASAVRLGDFVPIKTTYQADLSADNWVCAPGPGEGSFCTVDVGDLAPGAAVTVEFPVMIDEGAPDEWEVFNEAFLNPDGTGDPLLSCPQPPAVHAPPTSSRPHRRTTLDPQADDSFDTVVLYRLRDRIFRYALGGRRAIDLFFGFLGEMAGTTALSPDAPERVLDWILGWQPLFRRLIDGRGDTVTVTAGHTQLIIDYVASLKASATTPELLASLQLQEARLDIPSWVFAAGLTDVEVDLVVEDTLTGDIQEYHNDQKTRFQPIQDTTAFSTCDAS